MLPLMEKFISVTAIDTSFCLKAAALLLMAFDDADLIWLVITFQIS